MSLLFPEIFSKYPMHQAPFLHRQFLEWSVSKPLRGLRIAHHVPVVQNTLLKIACLIAAGADVVITNPKFMRPCEIALKYLLDANLNFVTDIEKLENEVFDIFLDCGAELFLNLPSPKLGAVELTGSGDQIYRQYNPDFPVISIDRSLTKQLETVFGTAVSCVQALNSIKGITIVNKSWMIFGFGKIGRGIAYNCSKNDNRLIVADVNEYAKLKSLQLKLDYIDARDLKLVEQSLKKSDIVITATGRESAFSVYPKKWFEGKILASMGILDEFGEQFSPDEVLNKKKPINFVLEDPTPIEYIDPELFAHNEMALDLLKLSVKKGVFDIKKQRDSEIIKRWCQYHQTLPNDIEKWFIRF